MSTEPSRRAGGGTLDLYLRVEACRSRDGPVGDAHVEIPRAVGQLRDHACGDGELQVDVADVAEPELETCPQAERELVVRGREGDDPAREVRARERRHRLDRDADVAVDDRARLEGDVLRDPHAGETRLRVAVDPRDYAAAGGEHVRVGALPGDRDGLLGLDRHAEGVREGAVERDARDGRETEHVRARRVEVDADEAVTLSIAEGALDLPRDARARAL